MTRNIKWLTAGFSALAVMLGGVAVSAGQAWADGDGPFCIEGGECYATLQEAFDVVPDDGTLTTIYLNSANDIVYDGGGAFYTNGKGVHPANANYNVVFDLRGKTYIIGNDPVGSTGYETQSFHVERGGRFVLKDGTVKAAQDSGVKMIFQNYADTTFENVILDASDNSNITYVASNNFGSLTVKGNSQILASAGRVAFDLWYGMSAVYDDGVTVTFGSDFTGRVEGNVEYGRANRVTDENWRDKAQLNIANGTFDITLMDGSVGALEGANINISGGKFTALDESYVTEDKMAYFDGETETYTVAAKPTVSGLASDLEVRAGAQLVLDYTLAPAVAGNWIDMYSVEENDLCGESEVLLNCIVFDQTDKTLSVDPATTVGEHNMEYALTDGTKGNFTLTVLPRGEMTVEDKTIYVEISGYREYTFAELGVVIDGEGFDYETKNSNAWVDWEEETVSVYGNDVITWSYAGEEKGKTTFKAYSVYDSNEVYGARVGGYHYWYNSSSEGVTAEIADETIAKFTTMTEQSGDEEYVQTVIEGVKAGETALNYVFDGRVVKTVPIKVYEIATTMQRAQAVGTSQTFTAGLTEGYRVVDFSVSAADSWTEEEESTEKSVEGLMNKDGTFTVTVNKMPTYVPYGDDEETAVAEKSPYAYVVFIIEDEAGNQYDEGYGIMLFEFEATDEAAEAVDDEESVAKRNEQTMQSLTADTIAVVMAQSGDAEDNRLELTLESGAKVVINDVEGFVGAIQDGKTIEAVLTEPETKAESELDSVEAEKLKAEMGAGKTGHRFVEINVELRVDGETLGNITDLDNPLVVGVDVSDDEPVAAGMVREYSVVFYHNGETKKVDNVDYDEENKIVSFESDRFSTYLIAYTDTVLPKTPDTGTVTAAGASAMSAAVTTAILTGVITTIIGFVVMVRRRQQR